MSTKIDKVIEDLKSLTLLEAAQLVKQIEKVFDVDASSTPNASAVMMPVSTESSVSSEAEEKTDFDVILEEVPAPQKIAILKIVRSLTSLGLKEAKNLVESVPKVLKQAISKEDAYEIKVKLEEAGAKVMIS